MSVESCGLATDPRAWRIGFVGYGEVGRILSEDLRAEGLAVSAYDIKLDQEGADAPLREHARQYGVTLAASAVALAQSADFVISAVTASQAVAVARACAPAVRTGAFFSTSIPPRPARNSRRARLSTGLGVGTWRER